MKTIVEQVTFKKAVWVFVYIKKRLKSFAFSSQLNLVV
jgi:hypothetical protein